eukprot:236984-Pyramimonas_sp.AAC.1
MGRRGLLVNAGVTTGAVVGTCCGSRVVVCSVGAGVAAGAVGFSRGVDANRDEEHRDAGNDV